MHEAGLAAAIASTMRERGLVGLRVRIIVTGGHDAPEAFDASLAFHLGSALADVDPALIEIVHRPSEHWCTACGARFEAVWEEPCPACGGVGLPGRMAESIEIEAAEPGGSSDPPIDDPGPSVGGHAGAQAGAMDRPGAPSIDDRPERPDAPVT